MPRDALEEQTMIVQLTVAHVIQTIVITAMRVKPGMSAPPEAKDWDVHDNCGDDRENVRDKKLVRLFIDIQNGENE